MLSETSSMIGSIETHVDTVVGDDMEKDIMHQMADSFAERQMVHFATVLGEKWACPESGHNICVPTEDGGHHELSDDNITSWVNALCTGEATTSQPPQDVLRSFLAPGSRSPTPRAVALAPARRYPSIRASRSVSSLGSPPPPPSAMSHISTASTSAASTNTAVPTERSVWSPYSSFLPSIADADSINHPSSHPAQKASSRPFKWLGEKSMGTLQSAVIMKRANAHVARVKKWQKRTPPYIGQEERDKVSEMLGDALEMARQCYPPRINKLAYTIGREVQQWLHVFPDLPQTLETSLLLIQVQICLIPLLLTRISHSDPLAADLAHDLITALTRHPLTIRDPDMAAVTIRIVARELAYARCGAQHGWLGVDLLRIVEMVVGLRVLTEGEQVAIRELAVRRRQQGDDSLDTSRPWEVALFALCASQNAWFKDAVLGPTGLQSLISSLDTMLSPSIPVLDVLWEDVALTLRALAFLSEHDWVAKAVPESIVRSLLGVFRRSIPERWFCIRFWAMDTIRNILSHRPPLVSTLVRENAAVAFATLAAPSTSPSSRSRARSSPTASISSFPSSPVARGTSPMSTMTTATTVPSNPSAGMGHTNVSGKTRGRLMEDYKREASKRAEELTAYIKNWTEWKPYMVRMEPVSIAGTF